MSWEATALVKPITHTAQGVKLTPTEKLVLMVLSDSVSPDTGFAWPSVSTLAKLCLSSERTVQYVLRKLEEGKLIRSERFDGRKTKYYISKPQAGLNFTPADPAPVQPIVKTPATQRRKSECIPIEPKAAENLKTPLPPASGGEETFRWGFEEIAVRMGRRHRLPNLSSYAGSQAKYVVDFLRRRGFEARVCEAA